MSQTKTQDIVTSYVDEGKSCGQIADEMGVGPFQVWEVLREEGVETRTIAEGNSDGEVMKLRDREYLKELYVEKLMSLRDIADELNVSDSTVRRWLEEHDIETRNGYRQDSDVKSDLLRDRMYLMEKYHGEELTLKELGERLDCADSTVRYWLQKHGIATRKKGSSGESHHNWVEEPEADMRDYFGPGWIRQRDRALVRDQARCQRCGVAEPEHMKKHGQRPHVHHIEGRRSFVDEDGDFDYEAANSLDNLVTLCLPCHTAVEQSDGEMYTAELTGDNRGERV